MMFTVLLFFVFSLSSLPLAALSSPAIGVAYRPTPCTAAAAAGCPSSDRVISAVRSVGLRHLLIENPDPATLHSLLYTDISLILSLNLTAVASPSAARQWLSVHLLPFHPRLRISALAVGRDVASPDLLLPAISNLISSCSDLGLPKFPISTVHSFSILDPAFPPSAARFRSNLTIKPLLNFLNSSKSPFLIDLYPFDLYRTDDKIPLGFAVFKETALGYRDDPSTGLRYRNLFDLMVDATLTALARAGYRQLEVVVSGTGWPGEGASWATAEHAEKYNKGLVDHVRSGIGTPMRKNAVAVVFVRELFDDDLGLGLGFEWEKHLGIWHKNLSAKYELKFSAVAGGGGAPAAMAAAAWGLILATWCLLVAEV